MPRWLWLMLIGILGALWWVGHRSAAPLAAVPLATGVVDTCPPAPWYSNANEPRQSEVAGRIPPFRLGDATVLPLAGFSLEARVLSREDYSIGTEADYSPTDLALGWGPMSEPGMAERLNVSQGGRFYRYSWGSEGPPIDPGLIIRNSANMHMVPADRNVAQALARVDAGDIVRLNGWLIRIDRDNGWHWQSSLTREDSGAGACEVVYVCSIATK